VRALAAFAAAIAVVAAVLAWQARPQVQPVAVATAPVPASAAASPSTAIAVGSVVVAVTGRVRHPGLVRLSAGARVADAIDAAGGVLPGTDLSLVNVARKVTDGELIVVGLAPASIAAGWGGGGGSTGSGPPAGPVNLNTANPEQLQTLPGVGPVLAQRIIDYREAHGGFGSVADLRKVSGIGDTRFAQLKDLVTV
jgi:competence protein ComEA